MTKTKIRLLILLSLFPFLVFITKVKAYDLSGIPKATRIDYGLYYDTTLVTSPLPSCTSSNEYDCYITDISLPNASNTYNNFRIVVRDNMNTNFSVGTQYKISMYFEQETAGYWFSSARITQVTGNTYRNFTNWTSDDITIISYSLSLLDNEDGMYRFDVVFVPSTTQVAGFNFRIWQDYETVSNNNNNYIRMWRNVSISQLTPGQIDYTQNFDNVIDNQNQNTQYIIDNQNANTQAIIKSNMTCNYNLFNNSNWEWGSLSSSTGNKTDNGVHRFMRTKDFITIKPNITYNVSIKSGYYIHLLVYYNDGTFSSSQLLSGASRVTFTTPNNINQIKFYWRTSGTSTEITESVSALNIFIGSEDDCVNKIDAVKDALTDETPPDTSGLSNAAGWLPPGPVDSILNLPLTLLQSLNNAFSTGSCQPLVIHFPHIANDVPIPCMSTIWQNFGLLPLFTWIGRVIGGILLYKYLINLYKWVDDTLTMRENNNFDDGSLG